MRGKNRPTGTKLCARHVGVDSLFGPNWCNQLEPKIPISLGCQTRNKKIPFCPGLVVPIEKPRQQKFSNRDKLTFRIIRMFRHVFPILLSSSLCGDVAKERRLD